MAGGEVGGAGVAIDTVDDLERLFHDIPLDKVSTSMTINATAPIHALLLPHDHVHREQDRRGGVDGHRGGDLVERDLVEQPLQVVHAIATPAPPPPPPPPAWARAYPPSAGGSH